MIIPLEVQNLVGSHARLSLLLRLKSVDRLDLKRLRTDERACAPSLNKANYHFPSFRDFTGLSGWLLS